ncbi:MAG: hypothetical protein GY765_27625 [bacterium]|nr:hypothetical protein [bacterium]
MKRAALLVVITLFFLGVPTIARAADKAVKNNDITVGRIYFPRAFVHEGKDYNKGVYRVVLTEKEGVPWFKVLSKKKEFLFEEMAVTKPFEGKNKRFKYRVHKEMLRGYEYFRIKVTKPDNMIMAYFLLKKPKVSEKKKKPAEPKKAG